MIVGIRWFKFADDGDDTQPSLQFREENGPWQTVPFVLGPVWASTQLAEDTVRGDGADPVHETVRQLGSEP